MDKISELQRAALVAEMRSLLEAASAQRSLPSRSRNYDRPETEVDDFGSRITTEQGGLRSHQIELASLESQIDPRLAQGDASALSAALARFLSGACPPRCDRAHVVMRGAVEALAQRPRQRRA